jgi:hypothetical protein
MSSTETLEKLLCLSIFTIFAFPLSGIVLYLISTHNQYVGIACSCGKINYYIDEYQSNETYNISYVLFCPSTFHTKTKFMEQCYGYENCTNLIQYMKTYDKTSLCCIDNDEIQEECLYTVYGAIGPWFIFLGFVVGLLLFIVGYVWINTSKFLNRKEYVRVALLKSN